MVRRLDSLIEMKQQEANRLEVAETVIHPEINRHIKYLDDEIKRLQMEIKNHYLRLSLYQF